MPHWEDIETVTSKIKRIADWDQLKAVPKIHTALRNLGAGRTEYLMQSGYKADRYKEFY